MMARARPAAATTLLLPLLFALLPRPASARIWKQGWTLAGSICQNALPAVCTTLCSTWTQSENSVCQPAAPGSIIDGKWSMLTLDTESSASFMIFSDAACSTPMPTCNFTDASVDGICAYKAMCAGYNGAEQTQYNYRFQLSKNLPSYVIVLIIVFAGVLPLMLIVLACYCCCCRGRAKTDPDIEAQREHEYTRGTYTREQLRQMEYAQRHPPRRY